MNLRRWNHRIDGIVPAAQGIQLVHQPGVGRLRLGWVSCTNVEQPLPIGTNVNFIPFDPAIDEGHSIVTGSIPLLLCISAA